MPFRCRGKCDAWGTAGHSWYKRGLKKCRGCDRATEWEGVYCPCCGGRLTTRPVHGKSKVKRQ